MKSLLRKHKTNNSETARDSNGGSVMDDDDMKSVRSSATTTSKIGGFLKSKIHVPTFSSSKLLKHTHQQQHHSSTDIVMTEEYHETEETKAAQKPQSGFLRENVNVLNQVEIPSSNISKVSLRELQQELESEKRKSQQLQKDFEAEQANARKRLTELQNALERERQNYHAIASGDGADATVRRQAETIQELQAMTEALQMRADQLEEDYAESERKCGEIDTLQIEATSLKAENAKLKQQSGGNESIKALEREREMLRQRVLALEAENKKKISAVSVAIPSSPLQDKIKALEAEKLAHVQEVKSLQGKVAALESRLQIPVRKIDPTESEEYKTLLAQFAEKERELAGIASAAEGELSRLDEEVKSQQRQRESADGQAKALQQELIKVKGEMSRLTAYWKEKLEHDEHYQRAADAARQLLKQKKISKAEFDQVMRAAQEASKVWND
jgi:hypothetical protein